MKYLSIRQTSEKWGITPRRIQILCKENRIPGAQQIGYAWAIPENAEKPADARVKRKHLLLKRREQGQNE